MSEWLPLRFLSSPRCLGVQPAPEKPERREERILPRFLHPPPHLTRRRSPNKTPSTYQTSEFPSGGTPPAALSDPSLRGPGAARGLHPRGQLGASGGIEGRFALRVQVRISVVGSAPSSPPVSFRSCSRVNAAPPAPHPSEEPTLPLGGPRAGTRSGGSEKVGRAGAPPLSPARSSLARIRHPLRVRFDITARSGPASPASTRADDHQKSLWKPGWLLLLFCPQLSGI